MRVKLLRRHEASTVLLAYPATIEEYHQALSTLGRPACPAAGHVGTDPDRDGRGRAHGCYVVTTAEQRRRWGLPDLSAPGRARMVDESRAFDVLGDAGAWSRAAVELPADPGAAPSPRDHEPDGADSRGGPRGCRAGVARRSGARGARVRRLAAFRRRAAAEGTRGVGRVRERSGGEGAGGGRRWLSPCRGGPSDPCGSTRCI